MRREAQTELVFHGGEDGAAIIAGGRWYVDAGRAAFAYGSIVPLCGEIVEAGETGAIEDGAPERSSENAGEPGHGSYVHRDRVRTNAEVGYSLFGFMEFRASVRDG